MRFGRLGLIYHANDWETLICADMKPLFASCVVGSMTQQADGFSTIERAFQIAESGKVSSVEEIARHLSREGYSSSVLTGPSLLKQLRERISASKPAAG